MKYRFFSALALVLVLSSCDPPVSESSGKSSAEERAAEAETKRLEKERAQLQVERDEIEAEKLELQQMREALLAEKEAELEGREQELVAQDDEAQRLAAEMTAQQEELDRREQELGEQELEQAGTTVIDDWTPSESAVVQQPVADYDLFYDGLDPYGSWFETPDYGYVYQPTVVIQNRSWRPYTRGRWICSNLGWTWRSDEPFGWATYHYGRWALLANRGWCWVPGSEWAPSWVAWRQGGGHVGWAPLPPETLAYRRGWGASVDADLGIGHSWFNFVEARHMANPLARHCLPIKRNRHFYGQTRGCTNIQYQRNRIISGGPSYVSLRPLIGKPWPVCILDLDSVGGFGKGRGARQIRDGSRKGNRLQIFAPSLDAPWNPALRPNRVADRWNKVQVVRASSGLEQTWKRRFAEVRKRQQQTARQWAKTNQDRLDAQAAQLQRNREAVAAAQARFRENVQRQVNLRRTRRSSSNDLPPGVTRGGDEPPVLSTPNRGGKVATANERLARLRQQQEEAQERARQRLEEQRNNRQTIQTADEVNSGGGVAAIRERTEQVRQQRQQEAQHRAARLARTREQQQEKLRQQKDRMAGEQAQRVREQQERVRAAQEQAKQARAERAEQQQERMRQQQEKNRAAQEQAKQAQAERARQQQETARRAAEERARQQQEAAQRAASQRARQQEDAARRQKKNRRAAQERARQQQESARRAAEERSRRQEANQQKVREAQEKMRERIREQQEKRKK